GHDFAVDALARGAVAVLAARPVAGAAVIVEDVPAALGSLAAHVVHALSELVVLGVTGSSGKTTVKDMTASVLGRVATTVAPPNSFNNEIGLPLTALRASAETRFLMLEYSARRTGHIAGLTRLVRPRLAAVLNVGRAHLGEFGSREAIALAKGELIEALPADGVAALNADDQVVAGMAGRTAARVLTFGTAAQAAVRASEPRLDRHARPAFRLHLPDAPPLPVALRYVGAHQVANALAAAALAHAAGLPPRAIADALTEAEPASHWRMELVAREGGGLVVNDSYNANPESTAAALRTLAALAGGRRCWAVLGEMAELGSEAVPAHAEIGRLAGELGIDRVVGVGAPTAALVEAAAAAGVSAELVADVIAARDLLAAELGAADVVLVKGSRVVGLERLAEALGARP
ncbi:MAG: UDP-N-acetylmuramoyl-tripeptide--D-alanyl-D-alanine ligase, partial [Mycobacteriales bacterium]